MSARDRFEDDEIDVAAPDASRDLTITEQSADRAQSIRPSDPRSRGEAYAELRQRVEGGWEPRQFPAPSAELGRFDPERAALPFISIDAAAKYIQEHRSARPWLAAADPASPEARRILATADAGGGHGHIRHEGWVTEEASMRRAAYLEDPAQLDPGKRYLGIDGLQLDDQPHRCRSTSTRITDPEAFATAFARGVEHPKVREALDMAFDPEKKPSGVTVPIADLLGRDGHRYCTGWRLEPAEGSMKTARANRDAWLTAREEGREPDISQPQARPVTTFEGGVMTFLFERKDAEKRYAIATMFPRPADDTPRTNRPELTEGRR
ncbi:MAG TPA: hypothetical protein VMI73_29505 [Trebonia sp.]|nr:hypothetical protein [Trebonia sp.]